MSLESGNIRINDLHHPTLNKELLVVEGSVAGKRIHVHLDRPTVDAYETAGIFSPIRATFLRYCIRNDCNYTYISLGGKGWKLKPTEEKKPEADISL